MILQSLDQFLWSHLPEGTSVHSPSIVIPFIFVASLLAWRLYRFTISPLLYPDRVKELPYWIPIIGHTISFFRNAPAVVQAGVKLTGDLGEPFAVQLLGFTSYFITKPKDIAQAYRNLTTLSFDTFLDDYVCCFGVQKEDVPAMNENKIKLDRTLPETTAYPAEGLGMKEFIIWTYKKQLSADKINELWYVFFHGVQETMKIENLQANARSGKGGSLVTMELREYLSCTLTIPTTKMLFGSRLLEIEPNLPEHIHVFIDGLWKLVYKYPKWATPTLNKHHEATMVALERFAEDMDPDTTDACWLLRTVILQGHPQGKLSRRSNAAFLGVIFLAALANIHATTYWLLCYILVDPDLKAAIQAEIAPAFSDGTMNGYYIVESCPLLNSAFKEVLRLHITSNTVRYVEAPTEFQNKTLLPGNQVMIPLRQLNHSPSIWGDDNNSFKPDRFIKNKSLSSHTAFRPFGGGINLCPGMTFAVRQALNFAAYTLYTQDIQLPMRNGKAQCLPRNEYETLAYGVSTPKKGTDLLIEVKPSNNPPVKALEKTVSGSFEYKF